MTMARRRWTAVVLVGALLAGGACSSDESGDGTAAAGPDADRVRGVVEALADDEMEGRDNGSDGSTLAQDFLVDQLGQFSDPLDGDSLEGYGHTFALGTNLIGVIAGGDRAEEYVVLGAHYDHLGWGGCRTDTPGDMVCNGAGDDASGVATVLEIGRSLAADPEPPPRTVVLALWDAEEDGLAGSAAYVDDPPVPLEDTAVYLNWDIQGSNLSPALADSTVMIGAETGGPNLIAAAQAATEDSSLQTLVLSLRFGGGRTSDHVTFAAAGVPTVFFTDGTTPCYHTSHDDVSTLDFEKLGQQIHTGMVLTRDLVATDDLPEYDGTTPPATYDDAVSMLDVLSAGQPDFERFSPDVQATAEQFLIDLQSMVDAGEQAFDDAAVSTLLGGSVDVVEALSSGECDGFLDP